MGKLFQSIIYGLNLLAALALLFSFALPYLPPSRFPLLSIFSLGVPIIIIVNLVFAAYWLVKINRRFLLSFILVIVSLFFFKIYQFQPEAPLRDRSGIKVLSYNVRLFNAFEKNNQDDVPAMMAALLERENPDVICIQEYYRKHKVDFSAYPYKYEHFRGSSAKLGYAIFSKYPLENKGAFNFPNSGNNTIYADIVTAGKRIRVYNMHLQSHGIIPEVQFLQETDKEKLLKRLSSRFRQQEEQLKEIISHKAKVQGSAILCGDMNNTPFSYSYRRLHEGMNDAFMAKGSGLGTTFPFLNFPLRIDFIFASKDMEVLSFKTLEETFSDHHGILAEIGWPK